ncbi:hypothetical protein WJX79_010550 [Trebouxia sp. C0005]
MFRTDGAVAAYCKCLFYGHTDSDFNSASVSDSETTLEYSDLLQVKSKTGEQNLIDAWESNMEHNVLCRISPYDANCTCISIEPAAIGLPAYMIDANMTAAEIGDEHFATHLAQFGDNYLDTSQPDMEPLEQASLADEEHINEDRDPSAPAVDSVEEAQSSAQECEIEPTPQPSQKNITEACKHCESPLRELRRFRLLVVRV